jgi:hypothetical protein
MATNPPNDNSIDALLEQRARYEQWLTKLDGAANSAPATVRSKIRGDYEARLRGVIERLRGHSATIAGELERHQSSQSQLDGQRRQAEEELAEAEVRYAVGEYTEEEWQRIRGESDGRLHHLRQRRAGDQPTGRGAAAHRWCAARRSGSDSAAPGHGSRTSAGTTAVRDDRALAPAPAAPGG